VLLGNPVVVAKAKPGFPRLLKAFHCIPQGDFKPLTAVNRGSIDGYGWDA
jgi:hypothetical protein